MEEFYILVEQIRQTGRQFAAATVPFSVTAKDEGITFQRIAEAFLLYDEKYKGYYETEAALKLVYPTPELGWRADVGTYPDAVYVYDVTTVNNINSWHNTGKKAPTPTFDVTTKVDKTTLYNTSQLNANYAYTDRTAARNAVPTNVRTRLQVILYSLADGTTVNEQFIGTNPATEWTNSTKWLNLGIQCLQAEGTSTVQPMSQDATTKSLKVINNLIDDSRNIVTNSGLFTVLTGWNIYNAPTNGSLAIIEDATYGSVLEAVKFGIAAWILRNDTFTSYKFKKNHKYKLLLTLKTNNSGSVRVSIMSGDSTNPVLSPTTLTTTTTFETKIIEFTPLQEGVYPLFALDSPNPQTVYLALVRIYVSPDSWIPRER